MLLLWIIYVISVLFLLCFRAYLFIDALWSPAGRGTTSWFLSVMSNCEVVAFPLVSLVRCGGCLYRFLIFALFLTSLFADCPSAQLGISGLQRVKVDSIKMYRHIMAFCNKVRTREWYVYVFFSIFQGCIPTIGRAMVVNAAQLASYSQAKEGLKSTGKIYLFEKLF